MLEEGFTHTAAADCTILIIGSMPSRKSLDAHQYYAHPRNAFWPIMAALFKFNDALPYPQRLAELRNNGIGLWDAAHQCIRAGSLDSAIQATSIISNDFADFYSQHPQLRCICFNGQKAAQIYRQRALPELPACYKELPHLLLPSTSPAHAAMTFEQKLHQWQRICTNPPFRSASV
ncbi:MAG: DNA-deoxyinosine glycosylase [Mariprofundus sp.]